MQQLRPAIAVLLACSLVGCAAMQKPWGRGALIGAGVLAAAGGTAGGIAANNGAFDDADDQTRGAAVGIGLATGAVTGALLGHLLFDAEAPEPVAVLPPPPPPPPPPTPMLVLTGTQFAFNSAALTPSAIDDLQDTLESLRADPDLRIRIDGHTDSIGSDSYNLRLSKRRAESIKDYLVSQGISADRVTTRGLGSRQPVADNSTEEGRARNRRVEVFKES